MPDCLIVIDDDEAKGKVCALTSRPLVGFSQIAFDEEQLSLGYKSQTSDKYMSQEAVLNLHYWVMIKANEGIDEIQYILNEICGLRQIDYYVKVGILNTPARIDVFKKSVTKQRLFPEEMSLLIQIRKEIRSFKAESIEKSTKKFEL